MHYVASLSTTIGRVRPAAVALTMPAYIAYASICQVFWQKKWLQPIIDRDCNRSSRSVGRVGKCYVYGAVVKVCTGCGQVSCP